MVDRSSAASSTHLRLPGGESGMPLGCGQHASWTHLQTAWRCLRSRLDAGCLHHKDGWRYLRSRQPQATFAMYPGGDIRHVFWRRHSPCILEATFAMYPGGDICHVSWRRHSPCILEATFGMYPGGESGMPPGSRRPHSPLSFRQAGSVLLAGGMYPAGHSAVLRHISCSIF